jgi:hypothetical protein
MEIITKKTAGSLFHLASLFFIAFLFWQCEGPMGPEGPRGANGYDGADGADGTAFSYSAIYDVEANDWFGNVNGYRVFLDVPEINEDIYYDGALLVYRLFEIEPYSFNMLPYTYVDNLLISYMDYDAYIGGIDLLFKEVYDGVNDTNAPENLMTFKVVIIDGIPLAKLKTMVDVSDYNAVTKMFKVPESGTVVVR